MREDAGDFFRKLSRQNEFILTNTHLELLRKASVEWDWIEFGAPSIDPKRPYGNTNVLSDILKIAHPFSVNWDEDAREAYLKKNATALMKLHAETGVALQICLQRGAFETGRYVRPNSWSPWDLVAGWDAYAAQTTED